MSSKLTTSEAAHEDDIRERILEAAIELFAAKGFAATSTREIVEAAGVTKPMLYYYYGSKDGLCRATLMRFHELTENGLLAALALPLPPEQRLVEFVNTAFELHKANPDLAQLLPRMLHGPEDEIRGLDLIESIERIRKLFRAAAEQVCQSGLARPGSELMLAHALQGLLFSWTVTLAEDSMSRLTHELAEEIVKDLLYGFTRQAPPVAAPK